MTLAFDLTALQKLAKPDAVFTDARQWSEYVGVVSEEPTYVVTNFTRKHRIRQDFFSGPRGREESLANVKDQFGTDRYVYVGTNEEDRGLAEAAGWDLGEPDPPDTGAAATDADDGGRDDWP